MVWALINPFVTSCSTEMGRRKKNRGYYGQSRKKEESGLLRAKERICNRNSLSSNKSRSAVCYRRTRAFPCLKNMSGWSLLHYMAFDFYSLEYFYEGERLASLLDSIKRGIDSAKLLDEGSLPEKVWFKKQFSIGVNDVTRVLERMAPTSETGNSHEHHNVICDNRKVPLDKLQAILLASDCNPRWLMKHLPSLASSRKVPIIYVKDGKRGSLRLGELVKLKTAIAIGVKARGNAINQNVEEIICGNKLNHEPEYLKVNEVPAVPSK